MKAYYEVIRSSEGYGLASILIVSSALNDHLMKKLLYFDASVPQFLRKYHIDINERNLVYF